MIDSKYLGMETVRHLAESSFSTEIIYSFVIILCSFMIYFGTKELYELSSHKGIKYFRLSFLYFGIAFFVRSFLKFLIFQISKTDMFSFPIKSSGALIFPLFIYFGSMSVMYLMYSILYKKIKVKFNFEYILNFVAILIAITSLLIRNPLFHFYLQLFFFIVVIATTLFAKFSEKKKHNHLYVVYLLLVVFWGLNILDLIVPNFFNTLQLLIYLTSVSTFLIMLYKVMKKTGAS